MKPNTIQKVATFASSLIGDTLLATSLYRALRLQFPNAEFTLVSEVAEHPVLSGFNTFDRVIDYRGDLDFDNLFDLVVVPVFCGDAKVRAHFNRLQNVISLDRLHAELRRSWHNKWSGDYTHLLFYKHQFELNADLARAAGYTDETPPLYCPQGDPAQYHHLKDRIGLFINTPQNEFQALPNRQWPVANWKALINELGQSNVVLVGGGCDLPNLKRLGDETGAAYEATATLTAFTALCRNLKALVTTDGGAMHVAATTGAPIVSLHGTSSAILLHPWIYPAGKCIAIQAPNTCSPCQRSLRLQLCEQGITQMVCMERIDPPSVSQMLEALEKLNSGTCLILKRGDLMTKQAYIRSLKRKLLAVANYNFARITLNSPVKPRQARNASSGAVVSSFDFHAR